MKTDLQKSIERAKRALAGGSNDDEHHALYKLVATLDSGATTKNGFDQRWIDAINEALRGRGEDVQIRDIRESLWDEYIGPMLDQIEDDAQSPTLSADELLVDYVE